MNEIDNIEIEPLEDEKIEEIETRLKVDDDERWYAPVVRWIVNRYKASRGREQNIIDQLKECREEKQNRAKHLYPGENENSLKGIGWQFANAITEEYSKECWCALLERIEQRTKEACLLGIINHKNIDTDLDSHGNLIYMILESDLNQAIDEARVE